MNPTRTPISTPRSAPTRLRPALTRKPAQRNLSASALSTRSQPAQAALARSSVQPAQPTVAPPAEAPAATFVPFDLKSCQREIKDTEASLKCLEAYRPDVQKQADAARGFPEHHSHMQLQQLDRQCAELSQKRDALKARMAAATADREGGSLATRIQDMRSREADLANRLKVLRNLRVRLRVQLKAAQRKEGQKVKVLEEDEGQEAKVLRDPTVKDIKEALGELRKVREELRSQFDELRKEAMAVKALQQELMATTP